MNRMNFVCCATNHSQGSVNSPHSFCPFIRVNMAEEELTRCVVDNDSGMCKACSAGDEVPCVDNDTGARSKAGKPSWQCAIYTELRAGRTLPDGGDSHCAL